MTPAQACYYLQEAMRGDDDLRFSLTTALRDRGYVDLYDWAEAMPASVVNIAESWIGVGEQELSDERLSNLLPKPDP